MENSNKKTKLNSKEFSDGVRYFECYHEIDNCINILFVTGGFNGLELEFFKNVEKNYCEAKEIESRYTINEIKQKQLESVIKIFRKRHCELSEEVAYAENSRRK